MNIVLDRVERCPVCNNCESSFLFYTYDIQFSKTLKKFLLVKCTNCGLVYLKERPAQEYIENYYPSNSYHSFKRKTGIERSLRERFKAKIKDRLKQRDRKLVDKILLNFVPAYWRLAVLFPKGSKILDIGCGGGWKLDLFQEFGWETYGFDISSEAVQIAKSKGHEVVIAEIENVSYHDNYFDAILISHVIEHVPNPVLTIKKAFSLLKKEGILLLETPNNSSLLAKIFRADFWQIDSPRHFQIFDIKSLNFLLGDCGFIIDKLVTNNSKNGVVNSIQALITRKYRNSKNIKNYKIMKSISILLSYLLIPFNKLGFGENIIVFAKKII